MLLPNRVKHRKQHRGRMKGRAMRGNTICHGDFGRYGFRFSRTNPSLQNRLKPVWVPVKVLRNIG